MLRGNWTLKGSIFDRIVILAITNTSRTVFNDILEVPDYVSEICDILNRPSIICARKAKKEFLRIPEQKRKYPKAEWKDYVDACIYYQIILSIL